MSIHETLHNIQIKLIAPKDARNNFGKYNYRSCESILEHLKPHLKTEEASVTLTDEITAVADRIYVKATATLHKGGEQVSVTAYAREAAIKKGMDESQITGAASSYARKYALCGLFAIDGNDDADALNTSEEYTQQQEAQGKKSQSENEQKQLKDEKLDEWLEVAQKAIANGQRKPDEIIASIESKYILTNEQRSRISALRS